MDIQMQIQFFMLLLIVYWEHANQEILENYFQIIPNGCFRDVYPPVKIPMAACQTLWLKAKKALRTPEQKAEFKSAPMISVKDGSDTKVCYNDAIWKKSGWCHIEGSTSAKPMWGICSRTCKYINQPERVIHFTKLIMR